MIRYCGRDFSPEELQTIARILSQSLPRTRSGDPHRTRASLSRLICEALDWRKPDGGLKEMSCRVVLLRMDRDGLLTLPPPRHLPQKCRPLPITAATDPQAPITAQAGALDDLRLEVLTHPDQSALWREYIQRYHYLGYSPLPRAQLRYMALSGGQVPGSSPGQALALLGFGAAAWKTAPRDRFIGWNDRQQQERPPLIVNLG